MSMEKVFETIRSNIEPRQVDKLEISERQGWPACTEYTQCFRSQDCYTFHDIDDDNDNGTLNRTKIKDITKAALKEHAVTNVVLIDVEDTEKWWFSLSILLRNDNE